MAPTAGTTPPIETRRLLRRFGDDTAVDNLDLHVAAGEIHAVVGLNGAGKTTLMRLLLGMLRPDAGEARIFGHAATRVAPEHWRQVGHLVESPFAYPELTVRQNVGAAALLHGIDRASLPDVVGRTIDRFGLVRWADRPSRQLSQGNRQRLGLASALAHDPTVLVLDEPANSLDPAGVVFIRDLLTHARDRGLAVLVSSHHLDEIARIADRITVLHRGAAIGSLQPGGSDLEKRFFDLVYQDDLRQPDQR